MCIEVDETIHDLRTLADLLEAVKHTNHKDPTKSKALASVLIRVISNLHGIVVLQTNIESVDWDALVHSYL